MGQGGQPGGRRPGRGRGWCVLRTTATYVASQVGGGGANWEKKQVERMSGRLPEGEAGPHRVSEASVCADAGLRGRTGLEVKMGSHCRRRVLGHRVDDMPGEVVTW